MGEQSDKTEKPADSGQPPVPIMVPMVIAFAFLMEQVDTTVIVTAIPQMARDLDTTVLRLNLAVTAYALTLAVFIPVSGWLADRFGARRIFVAALVVFTLASAFCGLAQNLTELVVMRGMQGLGGAMMTPVGRLILLRNVPRNRLITAMFYVSLPALIGPVIGPLLGGFLTSYASWRWVFFINLPFGLLGIVLALVFIKETRIEHRIRLDLRGFLLAGMGLAFMQLGIENAGHPMLPSVVTVIALVAAFALLAGFYLHARRHPAPVIDLSLVRVRSFAIGSLVGSVCRIGINGVPFLLPLTLQVGFGLDPFQSGMLTFFIAVGTLLLRTISSRVLRQFGFHRVLPFGAVASAVLIAGFALLTPETPHWVIAVYVVLFGISRSTMFMGTNALAYADIAPAELSRATSLGGVVQQLSISFGVSAAALLLAWVSDEKGLTVADFHEAFLLLAILPLAAVIGFSRLRPEDGAAVSGFGGKGRQPSP